MNYNRKEFVQYLLAAGFFSAFPSALFSQKNFFDPNLKDLINRIGNSNNDKDRVLLLEQLLKQDISPEDKEIIDRILFIADHWANGFEKYASADFL